MLKNLTVTQTHYKLNADIYQKRYTFSNIPKLFQKISLFLYVIEVEDIWSYLVLQPNKALLEKNLKENSFILLFSVKGNKARDFLKRLDEKVNQGSTQFIVVYYEDDERNL